MFGFTRPRPDLPVDRRAHAIRRNRLDRADAYDNLTRLRKDFRRGRYVGPEADMTARIRRAEDLLAAVEAQGRLIARGDEQAIRRTTEDLELQLAA